MPRPSYPIEGQGLEQMPPIAPGMPVPIGFSLQA